MIPLVKKESCSIMKKLFSDADDGGCTTTIRIYTNWVVLTHETSTDQVHPFGGRLPIILF